jgi:putative adhesin
MKIAQLIATVTFGLALPLSLAGQQPARLDTTVRLNLRGTVDLSLVSGKITVRGWDMPDLKVLASTEIGALRFDATANRVTLRVEQEREGGRSRGDATYDVSVPRGTRLRLQAASGNVTASGSQGEIAATTVSGAIDVSGGRRQVTLESVSGPIRASQLAGDVRAQNVSGSVRAENVSGRLEAWTVRGPIRLVAMRSNDIRAETVGGDIVYTGRVATGGTYAFESHSGTIRLTIPRSPGAHFRLETVSGAVQTDFPIEAAPAEGGRKGGRVEFTIGDGGANVTARTFSGRILIKSDPIPAIRRDSASIIRTDSASIIRKDSISKTRRDSAPIIRKDSISKTRRDSAPLIRRDSAPNHS